MPLTRQQITQTASQKLAAALPSIVNVKALVGLDGFVDEIITVVDKRHDLRSFDPVRTIAQLGAKISAAAGESSNYELVVKQTKLGGNGPIMANALASAGVGVTYVGNLGYPAIHPVFEPLNQRAKVYSIAEPGHTDALEFEDGKLMLGKHQTLHDVNWDNLVARVGIDTLVSLFKASDLIAFTNWTMLQQMTHIWQRLLSDVLPKVDCKGKTFFADLADPEKRTKADIRAALDLLSHFQSRINVTLGLNLKESQQIAVALGLPARPDENQAIVESARAIREKMGINCVVIHPRRGAAAATAAGESGWFSGPFVKEPKISTGAGDHFNAGFCLGRVLGLNVEESLCVGTATSGYYVRTAESPSVKNLAEFVGALPEPQ